MMIFTRNTARRGTLAISILTCFDMRSQIAWQAWYFVHIGYFQDVSIIALRVLNVWQAWYFGDPECRLCGLLWVRYSWEFRNRTFGPRRLPARESVNLIGNRLVRTVVHRSLCFATLIYVGLCWELRAPLRNIRQCITCKAPGRPCMQTLTLKQSWLKAR